MVTAMLRLTSLFLVWAFAVPALGFQAPDARVPLDELAATARSDPAAALALADMYEQGRGVDADPQLALEWRTRAAELGDISAQFDLGLRYEHGWGAPRDPEASRHWLQQAADGGSVEAQRALERALSRASAPAHATNPSQSARSSSGAAEPRVVPAPESEQPHARRPAAVSNGAWRSYDESADDRFDRRPRLNLGWSISGGSRHWGWSVWDGYPDPWYTNPWYPGIVAGSWYPFGWYDWRWSAPRHHHFRGRHDSPRGRVHVGIGVRH